MRIAFEEVSFTYDRAARRGARPRPRAPRTGRSGWGSAADAVWALRDVSFEVADGELLGVAGHTGSGKSTLAALAAGIARPSAGRVLADGRDLAARRVRRSLRGRIGLVFQYPERQLFAATVADDVAFGPRNLGVPAAEVPGRVEAALERVGLDPAAVGRASPFDLSGGQQRRVALAGVLALEPEVLVLDEPTAGLDPRSRREMARLVRRLRDRGLTMIMVSHSMDDLAALADRILVLDEGDEVALGAPAEVFADEAGLRRIGLGVPAAQALARRLAARTGLALDRPLYDLDALAADIAAGLAGAREGGRPRA